MSQQPQVPADWEPDDDLGGSTFREISQAPVDPDEADE